MAVIIKEAKAQERKECTR